MCMYWWGKRAGHPYAREVTKFSNLQNNYNTKRIQLRYFIEVVSKKYRMCIEVVLNKTRLSYS